MINNKKIQLKIKAKTTLFEVGIKEISLYDGLYN